jgi:hypothetical protein
MKFRPVLVTGGLVFSSKLCLRQGFEQVFKKNGRYKKSISGLVPFGKIVQ